MSVTAGGRIRELFIPFPIKIIIALFIATYVASPIKRESQSNQNEIIGNSQDQVRLIIT